MTTDSTSTGSTGHPYGLSRGSGNANWQRAGSLSSAAIRKARRRIQEQQQLQAAPSQEPSPTPTPTPSQTPALTPQAQHERNRLDIVLAAAQRRVAEAKAKIEELNAQKANQDLEQMRGINAAVRPLKPADIDVQRGKQDIDAANANAKAAQFKLAEDNAARKKAKEATQAPKRAPTQTASPTPTRPWGVALPGVKYPQIEGPGNPSWEARHPEAQNAAGLGDQGLGMTTQPVPGPGTGRQFNPGGGLGKTTQPVKSGGTGRQFTDSLGYTTQPVQSAPGGQKINAGDLLSRPAYTTPEQVKQQAAQVIDAARARLAATPKKATKKK